VIERFAADLRGYNAARPKRRRITTPGLREAGITSPPRSDVDVSKSPAKKAPPSRSKGSAGKATAKAAPKRPPATKAAKPPVKAKTPPKPDKPAKKAAAKPAAPAKKAPSKAPVKLAPKAAKPTAAATKLAPRPAARPSAPVSASASTTPVTSTAPSPLPKAQDKPLAKLAATTPAPAAVAANRFAERFSPPKPPPQRGLPEPIEPVRPAIKVDPRLANAWKGKAGRDLSEDELLAMPDSEYMNEKQLEFFRFRLQALKDDLLSNAGETTEHLREDTSIVPDPADRATIEEEHALELRTRDRERKLLKKISQSLGRIEAGDYGYCDETGEPIGLGRLLARPTATLSLEAQQRRELKQKMFGD